MDEMAPAEIDEIKKLAQSCIESAIAENEQVTALRKRLEHLGYVVFIGSAVAVDYTGPNWELANRLLATARSCPHCSIPDKNVWMRPALCRERVAGASEQQVIDGPQVRFRCILCGYGELVSIGARS